MSGRKIVTLNESRYNKLIRKAREADTLRKEIRRREKEARKRAIQEFKPALEDLYRKYGEVRNQLTEAERRLREEWEREKEEIINNVNENMQQIRRVLRNHDQRISDVEKELNSMRQREKRKKDLALTLKEAVEEQLNKLETLSHERFAPGTLNAYKMRLAMYQANIDTGNYEAAIGGLQGLYVDALKTQDDIRRKETEFLLKWKEVLEKLEALKEKTEIDLSLDLSVLRQFKGARKADFWVDGELSRLGKKIENLIGEIKNNRDNLVEEDLKHIERRIPELKEDVETLTDRSVRRAVLSEDRQRMAKSLSASSEKQGYTVTEQEEYIDNDPRKDYVILKRNAFGDEIVIRVYEDGDVNGCELNNRPCVGSRNPEVQRNKMRSIIVGAEIEHKKITEENLPNEMLRERLAD